MQCKLLIYTWLKLCTCNIRCRLRANLSKVLFLTMVADTLIYQALLRIVTFCALMSLLNMKRLKSTLDSFGPVLSRGRNSLPLKDNSLMIKYRRLSTLRESFATELIKTLSLLIKKVLTHLHSKSLLEMVLLESEEQKREMEREFHLHVEEDN